jgi:hypothetical protein
MMPPYLYKITVAMSEPDRLYNWAFICAQTFGTAAHTYSQTCESQPEAIYGFDTPQTPADLGPLVRVELLPNP